MNSSVVFDPSYGKLYDSEQAWRDGAEDKFVYQRSNGTGTEFVEHEDGKNDSTFVKL